MVASMLEDEVLRECDRTAELDRVRALLMDGRLALAASLTMWSKGESAATGEAW
jgi:hypothetical protein